jgi:hypothetical protein
MPWRTILNNKSGLPRSVCNSLMNCDLGYGVPRLTDTIDKRDFSDFQVWLNSDSLPGKLTRLHLQHIQSTWSYPAFPMSTPIFEGHKLTASFKYLHFLGRLATRGISIKAPICPYAPSTYLNIFDRYAAEVLPAATWKKARPRLAALGISYL